MDGNRLYLMGLVGMAEPDDSQPAYTQKDTSIVEDDSAFDDLLTPPLEMETQESRPLLKIFTGMHRGAQLRLSDGAYMIGSSDDCDIIIKDAGIAASHMLLNCISGRFSITPQQGTVFMDGSPVTGEQAKLDPRTVATIGSVHWGLDIGDATWHPDSFPTIQPVPSDDRQQEMDGKKSAPHFSLHKLTARHAKFTGTMIYIVSCLFFLIYSLSSVRSPQNNEQLAKIRDIFSQAQLPEPNLTFDKQGILTVRAYVPTLAVQNQLIDNLHKISIPIRLQLFIDKQIDSDCKAYTAQMQLPIEVSYKGQGQLTLKGFLERQENLNVIISQIKQNMAGVRKIYNHVLVLEHVRPELATVLNESRLSGKIDFHPTAQALVASGVLDVNERSRWELAKEFIYSRLGENISIDEKITPKEEIEFTPGRIEMPIASVSMGNYPYITLQDGKVYYKGAALKNGTLIKDILADHIVVEISGREYFYNF